jgi:signal transduction histidine kinase/ActR/RegA family two-component response regulator
MNDSEWNCPSTDQDETAPLEFEKLRQSLSNHKIELELQQSELERTLHELEVARRQFDEVRDNAPVAYFTHDAAGYIFEINKRARSLLGVQPCQTNIRLNSILCSEGVELFEFHLSRVNAKNSASSIEIKLNRGGINPTFVLAETSVLADSLYQTVMVDVSTRKRTEQVRNKLESELQQSQKMEVLHQLSGGIAHDFNNILQVLIFQSDFAISLLEGENEVATKAVREIVATAERGADLTRQMLAFSRKAPLEKVRCDLNEIISSAMNMIKRSLGNNVDCHFDASPTPLGAWIDPVQIEQALLNLCLNARDAMPDGGNVLVQTSRVFLELKQTKSDLVLIPGAYAVISVRDEGNGIPDEAMSRVFEPFFSTKEVGQGTGLGLSIIHSILRQHGGAIEILESNGQGTVIDIYLPSFKLPKRPSDAAKKNVTTEKREREFSGTVLVCDDEETILSVLTTTLEKLGLRVLPAADGREAIEIIENEPTSIDLLLTDVVMPEKDGRDVCMVFRQKFADGAVVFMSGHGDSVLDEQFLRDCNATFLPKPFQLASLEKKLGLNLTSR